MYEPPAPQERELRRGRSGARLLIWKRESEAGAAFWGDVKLGPELFRKLWHEP
jgi:hypothetical protein